MNSGTTLMRRLVILGIVSLVFLAGCGGGAASTINNQLPAPSGSNPTPTITTISPNSAVAGSAEGFTLTINGTNFVAASMVNFGGRAPATTFVSATQLTAACRRDRLSWQLGCDSDQPRARRGAPRML